MTVYDYEADCEIPETLEDFRFYVGCLRELFPYWRPGQTWFNALYRARPDLAERVRSGPLDSFYDDKRIRTLDSWLKMHWSDVPVDTRS